MTASHLNMMRLEGNGERGTEEATAIPPHISMGLQNKSKQALMTDLG